MGFEMRALGGRPYQVFVPAEKRRVPCVVFLHGVGQNGADGASHMTVGLPVYLRDREASFSAAAVFPQCRGPWKYVGEDERLVLDALEAFQAELDIDPSRVYLTGLSQGGCSTFDFGARYPNLWAALLVVCGAGRARDALRLARIPTWIFHGEKDPDIPPSGPNKFERGTVGGRDMSRCLPHARYTEFKGAGHAIWDRVYGDPAVWEWLFAQRNDRIAAR